MSHPIYVMAAVTTLLVLAVFGTMLWQVCPRDRRRQWVFAMLALGFLMSPAAFYGVRKPLLIGPLEPRLKGPGWDQGSRALARDLIRLAYAPLTEEPAKLVPWLLLLAAGAPLLPSRRMVAPLALSAGLGFAVGEIWLVAQFVAEANDPKLAAVPWYAFGGFLSERLLTCITHALFALPTVALSRRGWKWALAGLAIGMLLHGLGNAPILLMQRRAFGWTELAWQVLVQVWLIVLFIAGLVALIGAAFGRKMLKAIWSRQMICPGCGATYLQPIFMGLNCGMWRYEPCGVCHKWHWVTLSNLAGAKASPASAPKSSNGDGV